MTRSTPWLAAGGATILWLRSRTRQQAAERLAAATLEALLNAIDANDAVTGAHVRRTAAYALVLARAAGLSLTQQRSVERIALFHDIGKIDEALFDIVHDQASLSAEAREAVATHPQRGADVLAPLRSFYPELAAGVLSHHERWDGTGYPTGLCGADIPVEARVVAIADTFDALTHSRPYHVGESAQNGADVIREGRGTQFDPTLVDLFLSPPVMEQIEMQCASRVPLADDATQQDEDRTERRTRAREPDAPDIRFRWSGEQTAVRSDSTRER